MPFKKRAEGDMMYIVSTFENSVYLELAITAVEMQGIKKENILAVPLDKRGEQRKLFDSMHGSDGMSLFDLPAVLAVLGGIFGSIYGFVLKWGPFLWGLICIALGSVLGFVIKFIITKKHNDERQKDQKGTEVVLMIECIENQLEIIKDILWSHHALGVRKLDIDNH
jgi:hypothetical protein